MNLFLGVSPCSSQDTLDPGSPTIGSYFKSNTKSNTKSYLFETDFPNNVIIIRSGTYNSRQNFFFT